jgi:hypothetical protein
VASEAEAEALWVLFESGSLCAYNGWDSRPAAELALDVPRRGTLLAGGGRLWLNAGDEQLIVVDPVTARVTAELALPGGLDVPAVRVTEFAFGAVWLAKPGLLGRLGEAGASLTELPGEFRPTAITAAGPWLWIAASDGRLARVDPATGNITADGRLPAGHGSCEDKGLACGRAGLVATVCNQPDIFVLDPVTAAPRWSARAPDGSFIVRLFPAGPDVWAVGSNGTAVLLGDAEQPLAATVEFSDDSEVFPSAVAAGSLWIASEGDWQVTRIDAATGSVLARIDWDPAESEEDENPVLWLEGGQSALWGGNSEIDGISRIDPAVNRVVHFGPYDTIADVVVAGAPAGQAAAPSPAAGSAAAPGRPGRPALRLIRGGG